MDQSLFDRSKRAFDAIFSGALLILLSPFLCITSAMVATKLGRPILFRQARPGRNAREFELIKFRTMLNVDPDTETITNEQRMTPFGSKLRSLSIDELPSLLNILKGDMSFVGPRPLLTRYLPLYNETQSRRHEVRPGLTGLAQVNGRNALDWPERFSLDVHYVDNRSWCLDVSIILRTVKKVVQREGISSEGNSVGAPFEGTAVPE